MLYPRPGSGPQPVPDHALENPPDESIVLASRKDDIDVVVNSLFDRPTFTTAVNVYDDILSKIYLILEFACRQLPYRIKLFNFS